MWMDGPGWDFGSDEIKWQHTILVHWLAFGAILCLGRYGNRAFMLRMGEVCRELSVSSSLSTRT